MLEIICVIWLWKVNGRNAILRGQRPGKYRALTLGLWFGLEILGSLSGILVAGAMRPGSDPMFLAYFLGITGAAIGGILSYQIAKNAPQGDYRPEGMYPPTGQFLPEQGWNLPQEGRLTNPATIRIVEETGGYAGGRDAFFLNGYPVCMLAPGSEYTFTTPFVKNILTIGQPTRPMGDRDTEVHFIAAEGGSIEVHASAGRLLPQQFQNYTS